MTEEIWKNIEGYEGLYQISSLGRVKNKKGKILNPCKNLKGYYHVVLSKNGKHKTLRIHRLVAQTFIPNPDKLPCINHKDEDKTNNRVENLEWCTYEYNNNYGDRTKKMITTCTNNTKRSKPILGIKEDNICLYFPSLGEAGRNGFSKIHISECCYGKFKQHRGFRWMFLEDYLADWWDIEMEKAA